MAGKYVGVACKVVDVDDGEPFDFVFHTNNIYFSLSLFLFE
jgi:hypothetical protein